MRTKYKKVSPEYIAKKFLINNYVYSNIKVYFGLKENPYEFIFWTITPISYNGEYVIVFCDFDENVLYYASHTGYHIIDFIKNEIGNFASYMGEPKDSNIIIGKNNYWFDDEKKRRVMPDEELC